jgi:hypothetical protein
MQYREFISGFFWLIMGIILAVWSTEYKVGNLTEPGPGFLPLLLGLLLILASLALLIRAKKSLHMVQTSSPSLTGEGWKKVAYTVLVLVGTAVFFEKIGYLLTFFLLIILLMRGAAGRQSWKMTLLVAFFSVLGVYLVFVMLLGQQLPRGLLGV